MRRIYSVSTIQWNGIEIEVRWSPDYLDYGDDTRIGHLEVESIAPEREPLPITETGYRSHFTPLSALSEYESPREFVEQWLVDAAKTDAWRKADLRRRQLSLL